jgi:hypothetical protein
MSQDNEQVQQSVEAEHTPDASALALIEEQADASIRRVWHDGRMFFSVIDVVGVLTESARPRKYWNDLKRRLAEEEGFNELSAKIGQLKMEAPDGKMRETDAGDAEIILRIIQSIPSPKAEPVKQWLAKVGAQRLQEAQPSVQTGREVSPIVMPSPDAPPQEWLRYHEQMVDVYRHQVMIEARLVVVDERLDSMQDELESLHTAVSILPELLERLGPQTLSPEHQSTTQEMVKRLHDLTGYAFSTIYTDLNRSFRVGKYSDIPDARWPDVAQWFNTRIAAAERRRP